MIKNVNNMLKIFEKKILIWLKIFICVNDVFESFVLFNNFL